MLFSSASRHRAARLEQASASRCVSPSTRGGLPGQARSTRWFGVILALGLVGCLADTGDESGQVVAPSEEGATSTDTAALEATEDTQTCASGFAYSFACHSMQPTAVCPQTGTTPCSPYESDYDPECSIASYGQRQEHLTLTGGYKQVKVCTPDEGGGPPVCDWEPRAILHTSCVEHAESEIARLWHGDAAMVTYTANQGPILEHYPTKPSASCDITYEGWLSLARPVHGSCRHANHPLAPSSECGTELRKSAPGSTLAQAKQEAQSAWEVLGGVGPVPLSTEPFCPSNLGTLPTDRQNGETPGVIEGAASVSPTGAAQYSISLWVPEGRAGLAPELELSYSSQGGNGLLGVGFSLSGLSQITLCPKTMAQDGEAQDVQFSSDDRFCLDGQRLVAVHGPYGAVGTEYRLENNLFTKIVGVGSFGGVGPEMFRAYLKDGRILTFGGSGKYLGGLRVSVARTSSGPVESVEGEHYAWPVARMEDRAGNYIDYDYATSVVNGAELWPTQIRWTGNTGAGLAPQRSVRFVYEERPDIQENYVNGLKIRSPRRLKRLEMWGPSPNQPALLRSYDFAYANTSISGLSQLKQVKECDGTGACKRPTTFEWTQGSWDFEREDAMISLEPITNGSTQASVVDLFAAKVDPYDWVDRLILHWSNGRWTADGKLILEDDDPTISDVSPRFADTNADGRAEMFKVAVPEGGGPKRWMRFDAGNGSQWWDGMDGESSTMWQSFTEPHDPPLYFADLEGDGLPEALRVVKTPEAFIWAFRPNTQGTLGEYFQLPNLRAPWANDGFAQAYSAHIEGTARTSLLIAEKDAFADGKNYLTALELRGGNLWEHPTTLEAFTEGQPKPRYWFADINGDGLADALRFTPEGGAPVVHINTGNGFRAGESYYIAVGYQAGRFYPWQKQDPPGIYTVDLNFDGKEDVLIAQKYGPDGQSRDHWVMMQSTRYGFEGRILLDVPLGTVGLPILAMNTAKFVTLGDFNNDGLTDILQSETVNGSRRVVKYLRKGPRPDVLTAVRDGNGARAEYSHQTRQRTGYYFVSRPIWNPNSWPIKGQLANAPTSLWVVNELRLDDGQGGLNRYTYKYSEGYIDRLRGFLGYLAYTVTDEQTGAVVYTEYDLSHASRVGTAYPLAGRPVYSRSWVNLATGWTHITETSTHYEVTQEANGRVFFAWPQRIQRVDVRLPPGQTHRMPEYNNQRYSWLPGETPPPLFKDVEITTGTDVEQVYDADGNLTSQLTKRLYGGQYTGEEQQITTTFKPRDAANWLIGLPDMRYTTHRMDASTAATRTVGFDYYPTGLLKTETVEPWGHLAAYLRTEYQRNTFGLPMQVTATNFRGQSRADSISYDSLEQMFPTTVTNALGHTTQTEYHPGLGVVTAETSPNGLRTESQYDGFGRLRVADSPDEADTTLHYGWGSDGLAEILTQHADGSSSLLRLDRLGREVETRTTGFDGQPVSQRKVYDALGRRTAVSVPRRSDEPEQLTSFAYDKLGRLLLETHPDGTKVEHVYSADRTDTIDARNAVSYVLYDAAGRVVESAEGAFGSATLRTRYVYAPFNLPKQVQIFEGAEVRQTSKLGYDILGRRTLLEEYYGASATAGYREQSVYEDGLGRRVRDINAEGETISDFDVLGRIVHKDSPDFDVDYTWDNAPGAGVGRLATYLSFDEGVRVDYSYDAFGHLSQSSWDVADPLVYGARNTHVVHSSYDGFGRLAEVAYPEVPNHARFFARYGYNDFGHLKEVTDGSGQLFWRAEGINARGQLTDERFGNDVTSHRVFDPLRHVLRQINTQNSANEAVQQLGFDFDANGNLTRRTDGVAQLHESFGYNPSLNRLESWSVAPLQAPESPFATHNFHYDGLGRLYAREVLLGDPAKALTIDYDDSGAHNPYAPISSTLGSYDYDANGNQIEGPQRHVNYTAFGLPRQISTWTTTTRYHYGPGNKRLLKNASSGEVTTYIEDLYERRYRTDAVAHVFHVVAGGRSVAEVVWKEQGGSILDEEVNYLHDDHLGSPAAITDESGAVKEYLRFDPFGARADVDNPALPAGAVASGDVRQGFTGHEMEDELGLINMKGRIYDPKSGHFLSRDPMVQSPFSPWSYNRYAYVGYNPLSVTDPTGFAGDPTHGGDVCYPSCPTDRGGSDPTIGIPIPTPFGVIVITVSIDVGSGGGSNGSKGPNRGGGSPQRADENGGPATEDAGPMQGGQSHGGDARSGWQKFKDGHYFGTGFGEDAAMYYANLTTNPDATVGDLVVGWTGGLFSSLWTRDTYFDTASTLMTAGGLNNLLKNAAKGASEGLLSACKGGNCADLINCFVAGTPILTPDGARAIESLQAGEIIVSRDIETPPGAWQSPSAAAILSEARRSDDADRPFDGEARAPSFDDVVWVLAHEGRRASHGVLREVRAGARVAFQGRVYETRRSGKGLEIRATGETLQRIRQTMRHGATRLVELTVRTSRGEHRQVGTAEHPFYVPARRAFLAMTELQPGMALLGEGDQPVEVVAVQPRATSDEVFNFEVEGTHTYFVCDSAASGCELVHNTCAPKPGVPQMVTPKGGGAPRQWTPSGRQIIEEPAVSKALDKLSPEVRQGVDDALGKLAFDKPGLNQHALRANRAGQWAMDIRGMGGGRGAGRIIYEYLEDGAIRLVEVLTKHNY
ncbi:hypothetical protein E8A74_50350 [Polyangium fumosum]|uniref:Teneurin-like YD-shell domain-containing protein n=2 Tax=Polyangium fumosum TaxID=889272 RepID=A0A4U1IEY6_9BACT|nr:hypothetical protein E8A74_50350 [Polyangium fumosum]